MINPLYPFSLRSPFEHRRGGWSPLALFSSGEQGFIYDLSDMSTLFQDSTGATPVTGPNQPVGLVLDVHKSLALGPDLDLGAPTTIDCTISGTNSTEFVVTATGANPIAKFNLPPLVVGNWYKVVFSFKADAGNTVPNAAGVAIPFTVVSGIYQTVNGSYTTITCYFRAEYTDQDVILLVSSQSVWGAVGDVARFKGITCKQIAGNHASQPTAGKRPLTQGSPIKIDFDGVDDDLVTTFSASLGSACTVARSIPSTGASILTAQTIGTTFTNSTDSHALVIVDRALTASETTNLTAWLNKRAGL